ncbi:hypothetical protein VDG64_21100 [Xanthomonas campestris pv. raphani]|uniref:hypothetical protein n=1 Tax=Xanthomonas campestris TaxID=339 RepID=UPI002B23ADE1|nr:hypothetical protein [Xanthomonas campestris]MEA9757432.1 hypothetical protein [Xanthomonas campestris pv. raphani]MEA9959215.1 hypothetical protein [Xanthomonas campestris pv. raphani]MEA9963263.1 hypothetical protein [Xanthomonas campestris pv. raphani]
MGTPEQEVAEEIHRRQVQGQAAAQLTQPLLKRGWRIAYVGWAAPILPVIGFFFLIILSIVALIHGVLAIVKGNTSGGLRLVLAAWLGSTGVGLLWMGVYALISSLF